MINKECIDIELPDEKELLGLHLNPFVSNYKMSIADCYTQKDNTLMDQVRHNIDLMRQIYLMGREK